MMFSSWNVIILGFYQMGFVDNAMKVLKRMTFKGIEPDFVTIIGLTQLGTNTKNGKLVNVIH